MYPVPGVLSSVENLLFVENFVETRWNHSGKFSTLQQEELSHTIAAGKITAHPSNCSIVYILLARDVV